jgi:hypothetical protein
LVTYIHDSELQAITPPTLISTIHKSLQHPLNLFPVCCVFTSRSPTTASNNVDSSSSCAQVLSSQPPVQNCLTTEFSTELIAPTDLVITSGHRPHRKHCASISCVLVAVGTFLPGYCLETVTVIRLTSRSLFSNGYTRYDFKTGLKETFFEYVE